MNIRITLVRPVFTTKAARRAASIGLGKGIEQFHGQKQPLKFTERGRNIYKLGRRTKAYEKVKRERFGHTLPNVWTGTGRRDILRRVDIKTLESRASATATWSARFLNLSNALGSSGPRGKRRKNRKQQPDHRKEMERVNRKDERDVRDIAERVATKIIDTETPTKTVKI